MVKLLRYLFNSNRFVDNVIGLKVSVPGYGGENVGSGEGAQGQEEKEADDRSRASQELPRLL